MIRYVAVVLALLTSAAWAGDNVVTPVMRAGSAYESSNPSYRVIGMDDVGADHTLYVVASTVDVLTERNLNRIIGDIQRRDLGFTTIRFYKSVGKRKGLPAFATLDHLGVYVAKDDKTYFGVGAKNLQGAWRYGPKH